MEREQVDRCETDRHTVESKRRGTTEYGSSEWLAGVKNHGSDIEMGFPAEKGPVKIQRWQHQPVQVPKVKPRGILRIRIIMGLLGSTTIVDWGA
jgi:hypothetical protein